ncbi:hypothetical protein, partial [Endozoicomonas sp. ONNA2]|uniref:hypothetical protein n=1 Tax=Endozoicomonas sp. ONNA2 TaxID=2828741 RepID=UPI00214817FE
MLMMCCSGGFPGLPGRRNRQASLPEDDKAPLVRAGFLIPEAEHAIIQATLLAMAGITKPVVKHRPIGPGRAGG